MRCARRTGGDPTTKTVSCSTRPDNPWPGSRDPRRDRAPQGATASTAGDRSHEVLDDRRPLQHRSGAGKLHGGIEQCGEGSAPAADAGQGFVLSRAAGEVRYDWTAPGAGDAGTALG